ncbi:KH domain-containing protein [Sharpea azabuensis]|jgi:predicted RNA-binding protein YlqC (UPF0109 family)|uniref:KH domain-containing protein n=1 Tax=Sharpea porci TaxID=2652286 RepID=A0A844FRG2_9FIRM|nr:KH domain-containing protein [Sharpea porci]MDD6710949.1 KH domain-containing protein [Sharpea porci]MDY5278538.1 KH domain-containing protein [Sharpea porci]MST88264.1 KH domain-containing protein [Sharpea porci]
MDYAKTLHDIAVELVHNKDRLEVREMPSLDEDTLTLVVYADHEDIARLIGRHGIMANSIRRLMSVPSRMNNKHLDIKFESYGEE